MGWRRWLSFEQTCVFSFEAGARLSCPRLSKLYQHFLQLRFSLGERFVEGEIRFRIDLTPRLRDGDPCYRHAYRDELAKKRRHIHLAYVGRLEPVKIGGDLAPRRGGETQQPHVLAFDFFVALRPASDVDYLTGAVQPEGLGIGQ